MSKKLQYFTTQKEGEFCRTITLLENGQVLAELECLPDAMSDEEEITFYFEQEEEEYDYDLEKISPVLGLG